MVELYDEVNQRMRNRANAALLKGIGAEFHLSCKKRLTIYKYKKKISQIPSESEEITIFMMHE